MKTFKIVLLLAILSLSLSSSAINEQNSKITTAQNQIHQWQNLQKLNSSSPNSSTISAWILLFLAASISSAGGVGGGSLYLPILNIVLGLNLKTSTAFSSFMVTGGTLSYVLYIFLFVGKSVIKYDVAVLSEPCMLLGVSLGVVCNVVSPEWLITTLLVIFLACITVKTTQAGLGFWKKETYQEEKKMSERGEREKGEVLEESLLVKGGEINELGLAFPWKDVLVLVVVWLCFFVFHLIIEAQGAIISIEPCGAVYWLVKSSQVPFAIAFTFYILRLRKKQIPENHHQGFNNEVDTLPGYVFPVSALLTGIIGGLFGMGGGLLLSPVLLHIGVPPQIASATATFMVLFSSSMSMVQYIILGAKVTNEALIYVAICFTGSIVGLALRQEAVRKSGRASLVVFMVSAAMAISLVIIAFSGAIDVWEEFISGEYMGFNLPC
ncbi:hypothetical protein LUZ60_016448 [Juncus effusus]|nr:hypothetical protein LUZ60_016448 [Juncus effusus]